MNTMVDLFTYFETKQSTPCVLVVVPPRPLPVRRIVYNLGDIDAIWRRVAVQCEEGVWMWDVSDLDRIRIERGRDEGRFTTTWERREDDVIWLLVQRCGRR